MKKFKEWFDHYEAMYPTRVLLGVVLFAQAMAFVVYTAMWYAGAMS